MMPSVKMLGVLRNPTKHCWSSYYAFGRIMDAKGERFESDGDVIEQYILDRFEHSRSFQALRNRTSSTNAAWNGLSLEGGDRYNAMKPYYAELMMPILKVFAENVVKSRFSCCEMLKLDIFFIEIQFFCARIVERDYS